MGNCLSSQPANKKHVSELVLVEATARWKGNIMPQSGFLLLYLPQKVTPSAAHGLLRFLITKVE